MKLFFAVEKKGLITIPHPKKDIPMGTVKSILRQVELLESKNCVL